jgi:hypothetical protein
MAKTEKTIKKNYAEIIVLAQVLKHFVGDGKTKAQKKLAKISEKLKPYLEKYDELADDLRLDNASVDKDGNLILKEKGGYVYTKENLKKLNAESKKLNLTEIDFELIQIVNPEGLDEFTWLKDWTNGVDFKEIEVETVEI